MWPLHRRWRGNHLDQVASRAQFNGAETNGFSHLDALEPYASTVRTDS